MKDSPILGVLDLWSLGHSATQIAKMLGLPNFLHVERIIRQARRIGDKRAVLHFAGNGRLIGRPGRDGRKVRKRTRVINKLEVVPALPRKTHCVRGHLRTPENVTANYQCIACVEEQKAARRAKGLKRGRPRKQREAT